MNIKDARLVRKRENELYDLITKIFPNVPFNRYHRPEKFIGIMQVQGQKPVALFIASHQPIIYAELVVSELPAKS